MCGDRHFAGKAAHDEIQISGRGGHSSRHAERYLQRKTKLEKCSAETVYKLAKVLGVSMETLTESGIRAAERERTYEHGLPNYLQHDLDAYKEGLKTKSSILDCLWGELYGSINLAEISEGVITPEHAEYLRKKYLWEGAKA